MAPTLAHWRTLAREEIYDGSPWVRLDKLQVQLPNGQVVNDFYQLRMIDYAGIVAFTPDRKVVVERQYKHGIGGVSIMLPGGGLQDGEDPLVAAQRELLEETGYVAEEWQALGRFIVDSNHLCAWAYLFIARNACPYAVPNSGDLEEIAVGLMTPTELLTAMRTGEIVSLGVVAAVSLALTHPWSSQ